MKARGRKTTLMVGLVLLTAATPLEPRGLRAQVPWPYGAPAMAVPTTPDAQRNAVSTVRSQVSWLRNATRTAANYNGGVDLIWQQFQSLRTSYQGFTMTLTPQQQAYGANELAELSSGLDILQEAFSNYQGDINAGRAANVALSDLCGVLGQAATVWLQEFNRDAARLRVGW